MSLEFDPANCFFGTQTHVMTDELLDALDCIVWDPAAPEWFLEFFESIDVGEEFTVNAEEACWILNTAYESTRYDEEEENGESGFSEYFKIIFNTFDDFTNFQRISVSGDGSGDIATIKIN